MTNQVMLEEQVSSLTAKLGQAQRRVDQLEVVEGKYNVCMQERQAWKKMFNDAENATNFTIGTEFVSTCLLYSICI